MTLHYILCIYDRYIFNRFEANSTAMIPSLRSIAFSTNLVLPQNITNTLSVVGNLKIEDQFEFISHLFHYRSPDLNYEFATFSEVSAILCYKIFVKKMIRKYLSIYGIYTFMVLIWPPNSILNIFPNVSISNSI